jgi:hypothetical protein
MLQEYSTGVVGASVVDQYYFMGKTTGEGAMNLVHQVPDVASLILRWN